MPARVLGRTVIRERQLAKPHIEENPCAHFYSLGDCDGIRALCDEARGLEGEQDDGVLSGIEREHHGEDDSKG